MAIDIRDIDLRRVLDAGPNPIFLHDREFRLILANRAYLALAGMTEEEALGRPYWEVFPKNGGPLPSCLHAMDKAEEEETEEVRLPDGRVFLSRSAPLFDAHGAYLCSRHDLTDITALDRARAAIAASEAKHRTLLENLPQKIFWKDSRSVYVACNAAYARELKLAQPDDIAGRDDFEFYPRELAEKYRADDARIMAGGRVEEIEEPYRAADGQESWVHTVKVPLLAASGGPTGILGIFWDVTEQRRARQRIERLDRMYRTISLCNQTLVHATDELTLCREMCRVLVNHGGFRGACVLHGNGAEHALTVAGAAGLNEEETRWVVAFCTRRAAETGGKFQTGTADICNDLTHEPKLGTVNAELDATSAAMLPLVSEGHHFGCLWVGSREANAFDGETVALLQELAGDLAFGIGNLRSRAERMGILEKLDASLDHAVTAIAGTVEMRDPYTAGHQRRVAELACAIAREMGLDADRIQGLRMAGIVHDIGKIHVPAEILANPGKLTDAEFEIIKTHPRAGYEILKSIDFPWPVADIVLQHHERLDGSGYPDGRCEPDILLEARILAVADVVEAMASHRPYRPGFGIYPALQEISRHKGRLYDAAVADACLRLFLEKSYSLDTHHMPT
ncbi:MAG: PAS domain-containing protein [Rhodocyclaceae bacterium]|jgi:PAS domain S-box-containing protein/putative nucleotidyltransferase with HDIG domain|nr:PAS domain-containing protein [Rhodocyclaceae bacterium]